MVDVHRGLDGSKNVSRVNLGRSVKSELPSHWSSSSFSVCLLGLQFLSLIVFFFLSPFLLSLFLFLLFFFSLLFIAPLFAMVEFPTLKRGIAWGRFKRPGL